MPFEGRRFFEAVQMFSDEIALKYLRVLWFYWSHTHCEGLPPDEEGLKDLCRCHNGDWDRCKRLIFDNDKFFVLEGGKWHQKRCREFYEKVLKRQKQTEAAREVRHVSVTDTVTKIIPLSPSMIVFKEKYLGRVEKRIEQLKNQMPFDDTTAGEKLRAEYKDLKSERKTLMETLGMKI